MKAIMKTLIGIGLIIGVYSCNKEDRLDYTLQNYDTFDPGVIDDWIAKNMTDLYNIEVIYRYQRNMHDINKNIAPAEESKVIPQMEVVQKGFLEVYGSVGGLPFIKEYTPKQFVLFGSGDYDPDGSVKGGTADGGRRITLYGINGLNTENPNAVLGNLQVVHHEFTHILNQMRMIPIDFEKICVGDYYANWTHWENTMELARSLGFITPYARKNVGEDFAETLSHMIVRGQLFYEKFAYDSGEEAYAKFKRKETLVRDYMTQNFKLDVTELQMEFQKVMENQYGSNAYTFGAAIDNNYIASLDWDIRKDWALTKNISEMQQQVTQAILGGFGGWQTKTMEFRFVSNTEAMLNISFGDSGTTYNAAYDFTISKQEDGSYHIFEAEEQGTGTIYNNGQIDWVLAATQPFINYIGSTGFVLEWETSVENTAPVDYLKYGVWKEVNDGEATLLGEVLLRSY